VFAVRRIDVPRTALLDRLVSIGNKESGDGKREMGDG